MRPIQPRSTTAYMNALYKAGVKLGRDGYPWAKVPPELKVGDGR